MKEELNPELDRAEEEIEIARTLIAEGKTEHDDAAIGRLDVAIRTLQGVRGALVFGRVFDGRDDPTYPAGTIVGAISGKRMLAEGWTPEPVDVDDDQADPRDAGAPMTADVPPVPLQFRPGPEQLLRLQTQGAM